MAPLDPQDGTAGGNTSTSTSPQVVDPIQAFRETYGNAGDYSDQKIYQHLSDPNNFRKTLAAHPEHGTQFASMSDDDISGWSARQALKRPDLVAPPSGVTKPKTQVKEGPPGYSSDMDMSPNPNAPGYLKRLGESVGVPSTGKEALDAVKSSVGTAALGPLGIAIQGGKMLYNTGKAASKGIKEGAHEAYEAGENIGKGQPVVPNVLKAAYGAAHANLQSTPVIGPAIERAGADITEKNYAGAAGGLTGVIGQVAAPELMNRAVGGKGGSYDTDSAAAEIHDAVNPKIRFKSKSGEGLEEYPDTEYEGEVRRQLPRINQFAKDNGIAIKDQRSLAQASEGAANAQGLHFQKNILEPNGNELFQTKNYPGYEGEELSPGVATAKQLYKRLGDLNAELNPRFRKAGGGVQESNAAVRSQAELTAEASAIRNDLYGRLSAKTGLTPAQVAEANQATAELHSVAQVTRREAASDRFADNSLRNQKIGATNKEGLTHEIAARVSQRLQNNPSDVRVGRVFKNLNVPAYSHPPITQAPNPAPGQAFPLGSVAPPPRGSTPFDIPGQASVLGNGQKPVNGPPSGVPSALGNVKPTPQDPSAALASVDKRPPVVSAPQVGRGASPVPAPIQAALGQVPPTSPTGAELAEPPFSYPYSQGEELGEAATEPTAGSKLAHRKFYSENPSALDRIPRTADARANVRRATPNPPPAKSNPSALGKIGEAAEAAKKAEVERLKTRLKELEAQAKTKKETK